MRKLLAANLILMILLWAVCPGFAAAEEYSIPVSETTDSGTGEAATATDGITTVSDQIPVKTVDTVKVGETGALADGMDTEEVAAAPDQPVETTAADNTQAVETSKEVIENTEPVGNPEENASAADNAEEAAKPAETTITETAARELPATTTEEINESAQAGTEDAATSAKETAPTLPETVATANDPATTTIATPVTGAGNDDVPVDNLAVLAQWTAVKDGADTVIGQVSPSGKFGVKSNYLLCGAVAAASDSKLAGVYGQIFYPLDAAFAPNAARGRLGCGQVAGPACKMTRQDAADWSVAICGPAAGGEPLIFTGGGNAAGLCADGALDKVEVYCCDQSLAYDDVSGTYDAAVIAKGVDGTYGNMMAGSFDYLPVTAYDITFGNIDYGSVKKNSESVADDFRDDGGKTVNLPLIRNIGNTRLAFSVIQDDMKLDGSGGKALISYQGRLGDDGEWISYIPFEKVLLPGELDLSAAKTLGFAVLVSDYPAGVSRTSQFGGQLFIEPQEVEHYGCKASAVNEKQPVSDGLSNEEGQVLLDIDIKPEPLRGLVIQKC